MVAMSEMIVFLHKKVLLMTKVMNLQFYHLILHYVESSYRIYNFWIQKINKKKKRKRKGKRKKEKKKRK